MYVKFYHIHFVDGNCILRHASILGLFPFTPTHTIKSNMEYVKNGALIIKHLCNIY